jgi:hypothetical protein
MAATNLKENSMNTTLTAKLYQVADAAAMRYRHQCSMFMPQQSCAQHPELTYDLYTLAQAENLLHGGENHLPLFFTEEAAELLQALPNRYWFWVTIKNACLEQIARVRKVAETEIGQPQIDCRVSVDAVAMAAVKLRRDMTSKYNLTRELQQLSLQQAGSRAVAGILLIKSNVFEFDELIFNPIFAPGILRSGTLEAVAQSMKDWLSQQYRQQRDSQTPALTLPLAPPGRGKGDIVAV